ncbi:MAG: succinylglutamate desuccinylase/aspartoacylase family protein [Pseudomonadota bacterium]
MNRTTSLILCTIALSLSGLTVVAAPTPTSPGMAAAASATDRVRLTETEAASQTMEEEVADQTPLALDPPAETAEPTPEDSADAEPAPVAFETVEMPVAPDVDLSEPVIPAPETPEAPHEPATAPVEDPVEVVEESPEAIPDAAPNRAPLVLLGEEVAPGTAARLSWSPDQNLDGIAVPTPVLVVNGVREGKTLCLTAAVHGDELNGIEIVRRVLYDLDPQSLSGAVIGVPIVNLQGFRRSSRYLPDRRDLNRFFPGNPTGSSASRIAHSFFQEVVRHCDALVDVHTGSFLRSNLPQLRADMTQPEVAALTEGFGATAVLHSEGTRGTLRRAATDAGIPAVTLETGEPSRLQDKEIDHGTKGIQTLLNKLSLVRRVRVWGEPEPVYYQSTWVRASRGGLLFGRVKLGQRVRKGAVLGTITDPITNVRTEVVAPVKGRILGMALNQVVLPGFAAYRIGIPSTGEDVVAAPSSEPVGTGDEADTAPVMDTEMEDENSE